MSSKKAACTPPVPSKNKTMPSAAVPKAEALLRRNKNKTKQHYGHQKKERERVDVTYSARQCQDRTAPKQLYSFITGGVEGLGYIHLPTWSWS